MLAVDEYLLSHVVFCVVYRNVVNTAFLNNFQNSVRRHQPWRVLQFVLLESLERAL